MGEERRGRDGENVEGEVGLGVLEGKHMEGREKRGKHEWRGMRENTVGRYTCNQPSKEL